MDLRQLRYFVAVAEERHITRAAQRLGLQQPPLSQTVAALEAELGGALFTRLPRGVELTPAGLVLLAEAYDIIVSFERAASLVRQVLGGRVGRLSIGFTTSAMLHPVVATIIRAFRAEAAEVELDLQEGNAAELTERVQRGELAAGFLRVPVARPAGIVFMHLLDEALMLALPQGHALLQAAPRRSVDLAALAGERFILVRRPHAPGIYANLLNACREAGFEPQIAAEVGHMLTNINLVSAGVGISLVPASMREVNLRQVSYVPVTPAPGLAAPLTLAYLDRGRSPMLDRFVALSCQIAAREQSVS
jgi:DNA-binding transcriptional LysR family regulator